MEILVSIGERLREIRELAGKSQTEFADIAAEVGVPGATRQSQANYEKGKQSPSALYLAALAAKGYDMQYVITGIRQQGVASPKGEYRHLTKQQEALLDNLEHCPKEVQDAISKLALAVGRDDTDVNTETQKSA
jgi:transcriptional regulator with XRE-family HTH domain